MRLRDALRHILLGGLIAAGMGSLSMAIITAWLGLPSQAIQAGGAAGSAAYLVGVFGPAFIEVVLARLRSGKGRYTLDWLGSRATTGGSTKPISRIDAAICLYF